MSFEANGEVPAAAAERLQAMIQGLTRARGVRHAIAAVGSSEGEPIWIGTVGSADGASTPMRPRHLSFWPVSPSSTSPRPSSASMNKGGYT
jgi:hypothetical protein